MGGVGEASAETQASKGAHLAGAAANQHRGGLSMQLFGVNITHLELAA